MLLKRGRRPNLDLSRRDAGTNSRRWRNDFPRTASSSVNEVSENAAIACVYAVAGCSSAYLGAEIFVHTTEI